MDDRQVDSVLQTQNNPVVDGVSPVSLSRPF